MTTLTEQTTVGEWVRDNPARSRVFEKLKIDYCCGGKIPLAEACAKKGADTATVLAELMEADRTQSTLVDADAMAFSELIDHIIANHHDYLREELPRLDFMARKVAAVHGEGEPRLSLIRDTFLPSYLLPTTRRVALVAKVTVHQQLFLPGTGVQWTLNFRLTIS